MWHSDLTFQHHPPLGAMLHAVVVPDVGGDTIWADMTAAYASLSPALQTFLAGLTAAHSASKAGGYFAARDDTGDKAAATAAAEPAHHPVIRAHPETGRPSLFVNPLFTMKIDGLRRVESDALLDMLYEVATRPEHQMRWHWSGGRRCFLGQPLHHALRATRLWQGAASDGAGGARGRPARGNQGAVGLICMGPREVPRRIRTAS